jgi:hypothetical protein
MIFVLRSLLAAPLSKWMDLFRCIEDRHPGSHIQKYDRGHLLLHLQRLDWHEEEDAAFVKRLASNLLIGGWRRNDRDGQGIGGGFL